MPHKKRSKYSEACKRIINRDQANLAVLAGHLPIHDEDKDRRDLQTVGTTLASENKPG